MQIDWRDLLSLDEDSQQLVVLPLQVPATLLLNSAYERTLAKSYTF
ncbi:TPA: hypothetical protein ACGUVV_004288 [Vibrio vulnificus]|nr:hypothetical protein [Vibrio vulnificus]MCA4011179.1 hypothetical protein [Vibrio vulnificus]HAS6025015.1 hypothetical protein [Vibrio vulnificus]HAS6035254.1 hypothetical protein [Vibrio vulnificus]HAS6140662.1 hypothetical protein [Vibrio vulnificus]HAS6352039.1 hypothetical protein [Vibrio vulnificus]